MLGRLSEFTNLKKKKKNIYTTFKKKSQQEKLLSAQGTFEMSLSQPWRMGPALVELKWHWFTTFYEEKIIKILSDVGSQKKKRKKKKKKSGKRKKGPQSSFRSMAGSHGWSSGLKTTPFWETKPYPL